MTDDTENNATLSSKWSEKLTSGNIAFSIFWFVMIYGLHLLILSINYSFYIVWRIGGKVILRPPSGDLAARDFMK